MDPLLKARLDKLYRKYRLGILVRTGTSLVIWLFALYGFSIDYLGAAQFHGITVTTVFLASLSLPTVLILKRATRLRTYKYFSVIINQLESLAYTTVIYFGGGLESPHLVIIYTALIAYNGVIAPQIYSFIVANLCVFNFGLLLVLEHAGLLPHFDALPSHEYTFAQQLFITAIITVMLNIIALLSGQAANSIKRAKNKLRIQNLELSNTNTQMRHEIQDRRLAEEALIREKERFRSLVEKSPLGIAFIDQRGSYKYVNPRFSEIFGYTLEDVPDGQTWFQKAFPELKHRKEAIALWQDDMQDSKISDGHNRIMQVNCRDGSEKIIHFRPVPMENGDELITYEDITDKIHTEARLQQAQRMEAIGVLAGGVAHDLNNILSGLVSYPELLLLELEMDSPLRKPVLTIQRSGEKAAAVVQDLLTLARRGVVSKQILNINQLILDFWTGAEFENIHQTFPHIRFSKKLAPRLLNISGSAIHLTKTIMNLVVNAAEAIPKEGNVTITTVNHYADARLRSYDPIEEGEYVAISVADTGVGIAAEDLEKIFEPFYTKKKMGRSGTGLGMAVVWGTVKDHQGHIDVHTAPGQGTRFDLFLPASRQAVAEDSPTQPPATAKGIEKILVIDDIAEQREIASAILKKLGYSVSVVASGEEAVAYFSDQSADLIVLDMIMEPGIDGLETYRRIIAACPAQKAIIASGYSETEAIKEAQRLGAGPYIKKPYTLQKLAGAVRHELDKAAKV